MIRYILDPGHGGLAFGEHYVTKGKRSPEVPPGIYEGEFNRKVASLIISMHGAEHTTSTALGPLNPSLRERVSLANDMPYDPQDMMFISIHANAYGNSWNDASGPRIFVAKNASEKSRLFAQQLEEAIDDCSSLPFFRRETKESGFYVLSKTKCPAVLIECGFMTNKTEAKYLASFSGVGTWAKIIKTAMDKYNERIAEN